MDRGDERIEHGQTEEALRLYLGAHEIMHVPTTGIEVARTYARLGKLVEARDAALEVLRIPVAPEERDPFRVARRAAEELARKLAREIPELMVQIAPPEAAGSATLRIDGRSIPRAAASLPHALDPADHVVEVAARGFKVAERRVALAIGEHKSVLITLEATPQRGAAVGRRAEGRAPATIPPDRPKPMDRGRLHWPFWVGIDLGAAGLAVGAVAGIVSLNRYDSAKRHCTGNHCTPEAKPDRDASLVAANVSNVGFGLGAVGIVLAVTSWLVAGEPRKENVGRLVLEPVRSGGLLRWEGVTW
jgi:hypothetical protein